MSIGNSKIRGPKYNRRTGSGNIPVAVDFRWYGKEVEATVDASLIAAINFALDEAVKMTKRPGWTPFRTGDLMESIINLGVMVKSHHVVGAFGSPLHYALFQELGTSKIAPNLYLTRAGIIVAADLIKWLRQELTARGYGP